MASSLDDEASATALDLLARLRLRTAPHTQEALRLRNELRTRFALKRPEDARVCIDRFQGRAGLADAIGERLALEWPLALALDAAINIEAWKGARVLFEEVVRGGPAAPRLPSIVEWSKKAREVTEAMAGIVGKSAAADHVRTQTWRAVFTDDVRKALALRAPHKLPVLITGESGTGKELVARTVAAARGEGAEGKPSSYIALNIASVAPSLVNSALFGHVRGAFTGATDEREGVFRAADNGVLFLDEIGDASPAVQVRLLRTLQEGTVAPVGSDSEVEVKVRVIAATNRDLSAPVPARRAKGDPPPFRRDLLERLSVLRVHSPPLRERLEDIPELVRHFVNEAIDVAAFPRLIDQVFSRLEAETKEHTWPGNVRELAAAVDRLIAGQPAILDARANGSEHDLLGVVGEISLDEVKQRYVDAVLRKCKGNKTQAARLLGVSRTTLLRRAAVPDTVEGVAALEVEEEGTAEAAT